MRKIQASAWLLTPVTRNKRNIDLAITMIPSFIVRIRARGTLEKIQMRVRTTRRTVRNQERGGRDREGQRDQDFFIIEAGEGEEGTMETTWAYYEAIVWGTMINARLRERKRGVEWGEGLAQSLRDYGRTGHQKIDRTDYVLDDFKPILNAAILSLRGLTPSIPIFLFFSRSFLLSFISFFSPLLSFFFFRRLVISMSSSSRGFRKWIPLKDRVFIFGLFSLEISIILILAL